MTDTENTTAARPSFADRMRQHAIDRDMALRNTHRTVGDIAVGNWRASRWGQIIEIAAPAPDNQQLRDVHPATYSGTYVVQVIDDSAEKRDTDFGRLFYVVHNGKRNGLAAAQTADMAILQALAVRAGGDTAAAHYAARVLGIADDI